MRKILFLIIACVTANSSFAVVTNKVNNTVVIYDARSSINSLGTITTSNLTVNSPGSLGILQNGANATNIHAGSLLVSNAVIITPSGINGLIINGANSISNLITGGLIATSMVTHAIGPLRFSAFGTISQVSSSGTISIGNTIGGNNIVVGFNTFTGVVNRLNAPTNSIGIGGGQFSSILLSTNHTLIFPGGAAGLTEDQYILLSGVSTNDNIIPGIPFGAPTNSQWNFIAGLNTVIVRRTSFIASDAFTNTFSAGVVHKLQ